MKKLLFLMVFLVGCAPAPSGERVYKRGDIVKLKSGGPAMTVIHDVYGNGTVNVEWLDNEGRPQRNYYYQEQLKVD